MGEDFSVTPRLIHFAERVAFCPDVLYYYYCSNATSYSHTVRLKNLQDITQANDLLYNFFSNTNPPVSSEVLNTMRKGNFITMLEMTVTSLEQLQWLKHNFECRIWKIYLNKGLKLKIANILFQLGCLRPIVWGTKLLRVLRAIKKQFWQ